MSQVGSKDSEDYFYQVIMDNLTQSAITMVIQYLHNNLTYMTLYLFNFILRKSPGARWCLI